MTEVEIKLPVDDLSGISDALKSMQFTEESTVREEDLYFDNDAGGIRSGDSALRIRRITPLPSGTFSGVITFKGRKLDSLSMTRTELETGVTDPETMQRILQELGYRPVPPAVVKERCTLRRGRLSACLDRVEGLGCFLELEIMIPEGENRENALDEISRVLDSLGHDLGETTRISYLSQLQKKLAYDGRI